MSHKPTNEMIEEAQRGLDWRSEHGRGGTEIGIARARDIVNGRNLSDDTVKRMHSFFSRHEVNKSAEGFSPGEEGYPSNGRIAWALWGGDAGQRWARNIVDNLENERAEPDELRVGDFVEWNSSGGMARGRIERIERDGQIDVPDSEFTITGTEDDPAALIQLFRDGEATDTMVGHRFSTLTKIDPIRDGHYDEKGNMDKDEREEEREATVEIAHRSVEIRQDEIINEAERRVQIVVSTENPVERGYGYEILDHSPESVNLEWLNSGRAPLLLDHDPEKQIGVIESAELDSGERKVRARVRFSQNPLADEVFRDVKDGIRQNISVGYAVSEMEREGKDSYRVKSWKPMETSVVSIPADSQSRVGRSVENPQNLEDQQSNEEPKMTEQVDVKAIASEAARNAQKEAAEIFALASRHNMTNEAREAVAKGLSLAEFRGIVLDKIGDKPLDSQEVGLTASEMKRFSVFRALYALANPNDRKAQEAAAFEFEASRAAADVYGTTAQGVMIPAEVLRNWSKRDLNTSDDSALIPEDFRAGDFIDVLRNSSSVMQAGATMLTGLSGNVAIPKKLTGAAAGWIASEGGDAAESEATFGQVTMAPKTVGAFTEITRNMLMNALPDIEALVRDDLTQAMALSIDAAALAGTGSNGQPTGIRSTAGINTQDFAATNPTFAEIVAMETAVAEDNALMGNLAYIMPASTYGALKTTEKATGTAQFVVEPGGTVNGYRAIRSNQAAAGDVYFGNFRDALVGMYGGLDLNIDDKTKATSGTIRIVALQSADVAVRHAQSFCLGDADIA